MKTIKYLFLLISILAGNAGSAQKATPIFNTEPSKIRALTVEPGVGIHTNFGIDFLISNLVQWTPKDHLSFASHTSFNINNITQRYFNGIKTNYNYSINQKFGIGTTFYTKKRSHTFLFMVGAKYTTFKETLDDARFEKVGKIIKALSPDYGIMYSRKVGWKKYFYTFRMYVPLYPFPIKGSNILYLDSNSDNIALEFGIGIKII
ncbi:MAG: hypothetical protein ABI844_08705 [Saprospiraceae bacterium]